MGSLDYTVSVTAKSELGRFFAKIDREKLATITDIVHRGAEFAKGRVPIDTGALCASINTTTGTSGGSISFGTDHWKHQDRGTRPHPITGNVSFFWKREGRQWTPGQNTISHPGNRAVHFIAATEAYVKREFMAAARRNFS
jgi:hypothetical protein